MQVDAIMEKVREVTIENVSLASRQEGLRNMFRAAAMLHNEQEMDEMRLAMHACTDAILDNEVTICMYSRQLVSQGWTGQ